MAVGPKFTYIGIDWARMPGVSASVVGDDTDSEFSSVGAFMLGDADVVVQAMPTIFKRNVPVLVRDEEGNEYRFVRNKGENPIRQLERAVEKIKPEVQTGATERREKKRRTKKVKVTGPGGVAVLRIDSKMLIRGARGRILGKYPNNPNHLKVRKDGEVWIRVPKTAKKRAKWRKLLGPKGRKK